MKLSVAARKRVAQVVVRAVTEAVAALPEATVRLTDVERGVEGAIRQVGAAVLTTVLGELGTGHVGASRACPCGGTQTTKHYATCHPQTVLGSISVRRAVYRCARCGQTDTPLDARLGLPKRQTSGLLSARLSLCAALEPFVPASTLLYDLTGLAVSPKRTQLVSEDLGRRVAAPQSAVAVADPGAATVPKPKLAPEPTALPVPPPVPAAAPVLPQRLYLGMDGCMYCTTERDSARELIWREAKVGVWFRVKPGDSGTTPRTSHLAPTDVLIDEADPTQRRYVVHMGDWEGFAQKVWHTGQFFALEQVAEIVVLGDGAVWLTSVVDLLLAGLPARVIQILDIRHAEQHLWTVAQTCLGQGARALAWIQAPLEHLHHGRVEELVAAVRTLPTPTEEAAKLVVTTAAYYEQRRAQMQYPAFRAQGFQIGSGLVESACKRLVGQRAKGPGMQWTIAGAEAIATLRAVYLSGRWDDVVALATAA